ncbi:SgcJ/EcaC family oxidoreductase [Amycolatopsis mongoliensis]|uniref:SgcJ/EcaC family oxidoreductase n=1 Tax=Amycolatopsis mongoliensis TaxID=715475 RepID=A0A9Y2JRH7_9PSEU|nr:SgcJ/EcaC family oxidoreductase [Amycolatopsis sp. 4-36]WIY02037.1 SgcJ/EcaC family oxidoreductase [Amycolatopsis sp. 4-36]
MTTTTAEADVRAVLDRLAEAWNSGDAAAYGRLFTEDADYVTFFGLNFPGREAIESSHRALFEGPLKGSKLTGQLGASAKVRFVRPDVAVVVAGGGSSLTGADTTDEGRESTVGFVLVQEDGEWLITAFQNTRVSDPRG